MVQFVHKASSSHLHFPAVDPDSEAPRLKPSPEEKDRFDYVAQQMTGKYLRSMAPNVWSYLLNQCKANVPRSDGQRGRWSEYRVRLVHDRVNKATKSRLSPRAPALAAGLLEVAEANHVRDHKLEAICGLLAVRRDLRWQKK